MCKGSLIKWTLQPKHAEIHTGYLSCITLARQLNIHTGYLSYRKETKHILVTLAIVRQLKNSHDIF